jgi:hypothetical protein
MRGEQAHRYRSHTRSLRHDFERIRIAGTRQGNPQACIGNQATCRTLRFRRGYTSGQESDGRGVRLVSGPAWPSSSGDIWAHRNMTASGVPTSGRTRGRKRVAHKRKRSSMSPMSSAFDRPRPRNRLLSSFRYVVYGLIAVTEISTIFQRVGHRWQSKCTIYTRGKSFQNL